MSVTEEKVRELLQTWIGELDAEKSRVERALEVLSPTKSTSVSASTGTKKRSRKRKRGSKVNRIEQAIDLVSKTPGISGGDIAKQMKIKPNYLYRVLNGLVKNGRLKKDGRKYFPVSSVTQE